MRSPLPLLALVALIALAAAGFVEAGLPTWLAVLLGIPASLVFLRLMDTITAVPMRIRNRRVHQTTCPACGRQLGERSRWRIVHPDFNVECSACHVVSAFDPRGRLKRRASIES